MFKTISENVSAEIIEKKSKFIANIFYVENIEEVEEILKNLRKKYFDARHNCFAFRIITKTGVIERFSDDGEPSGTAGSPMLSLIANQNIGNVLIVVTRYFGGILLGTGGLVRAYTLSAQEALKKAEFKNMELGIEAEIQVKYSDLDKIKYYCKNMDIKITQIEYLEDVKVVIELTNEKFIQFQDMLVDNGHDEKIKKNREKYITL